jgi:hypothetical protein
MLDDEERAELARVCRGQARLASSPGVRKVLVELADRRFNANQH